MTHHASETRESKTESEHQPAPTSVQPTGQPIEQATGHPDKPPTSASEGTEHSRQKKALELNVEGEQGQRHPDLPAGQHATGSFTNEASKRSPED